MNKALFEFQSDYYKRKKKQELGYWVDRPFAFHQTHVKDDMEEFVH